MADTSRTRKRAPREAGRGFFSLLAAVLLIASGVGSVWIVATSGVFGGVATGLDGPLPAAQVEDAAVEVDDGARVLFNAQLSQPRDPFRPLIDESSPIVGVPGVGGTPGDPGDPGNGNGNGNGNGFTPGTTTIMLAEIREVDDVFRATMVVDGTEYDVGVGDTFATSYQVVSLDEDSGVFLFGDSAFTLTVGQQILK